MPVIPALGRLKQEDYCKVEASLGYTVSSWIHRSQDNTKRTRNIPTHSTVAGVTWEMSPMLPAVQDSKPKLVQFLKQEAQTTRIPTEATTHWAAPDTSRSSEKACG